MYKFHVSIVFMLLVYSTAFSQHDKYRFTQYNISKGLSHNQVNAILKDKHGFMWFGTLSGLNRFDGYKFKIFKHELSDPKSLNDDCVINLLDGPEDKLWVQTRVGWQMYNPLTETFERNTAAYLKNRGMPNDTLKNIVKAKEGSFYFLFSSGVYHLGKSKSRAVFINPFLYKLSKSPVSGIAVSSKNTLWVLHNNGALEHINYEQQRLLARKSVNNTGIGCRLYCDSDDELWLFNTGVFNGVYWYSPKLNKVWAINTNSASMRLNNNIISAISQDDKGHIWLATDHGGANVIDKKQETVTYLLNNANDDKSVAQNSVSSIYADGAGGVWLGTFKKGISYYKENALLFPLYKHNPYSTVSLPYDDVNRFVEDAYGNIWIGTNGGGLIKFDPKHNSYKQYLHNASNNSISNDVVVSLWIDKKGILWIGTYYGGLDRFDGKTFTNFRHNPADANSIADDRVWEIYEDSAGRLWVGTLSGGLDLFNRQANKFIHHKRGGKYDIHSTYISSITEDRNGNLWLGTSDGIDILEKNTGRFINFKHAENNASTLSNDNVNAVLYDSRKLMWIATREGLDVFNEQRRKLYTLRKEQGLPDNTVLTVIEDKIGRVWVSTPNGLSAISVKADSRKGYSFSFRNYDDSDGLQGREFNENAAFTTRSGYLIFGGAGGFNFFNPSHIITDQRIPEIVFTDLQLFNKSIQVNEKIGSGIVLSQSITSSHEIVLPYNQNVFSIEFSALNFVNPYKCRYAYKMDGFNKEWLFADAATRKATFTNLNEGTYTLMVRASNESGIWNTTGIALTVKILPPWWRTPWAYISYVLIAGGSLYFIRRKGIQKLKQEFAIEQERQEARRMHELDMMKIKFFTNISHEFRTPLSLILTPVEKLLTTPAKHDETRQYKLIHRNARRLLNLVNQLMDFRKLEVKELKLQTKRGDIAAFVKDVCNSFTDVADKKNISFSFHSDVASLHTFFDHEKLERILFNLLSNAFKFTPENGSVYVKVAYDNAMHQLSIVVKDSGIGIAPEKHDKVFDRFFQDDVPGSIMNQGSGIGLSIVREFVKLHSGTITLTSSPGKGSVFTVQLPLKPAGETVYADSEIIEEAEVEVPQNIELPSVTKKYTVLVVEDNEDFRFYIKDNLLKCFNVAEAANGREGWQKALSIHPELILSDISMPEMDGNELCRRIRNDSRTQHIPVILLTALTGEDQQLKGLETGASDYVTKPFNFEILVSKIWNLIRQHESFKKTYKKQIEIKHSAPEIESYDEKLLKRVVGLIEEHIADPELSVEDLSKRTHMSRVGFYKKMLQLTGKTPVEYIKYMRLQRAVQLLEKSRMTISEIAYEVGYSDPKYFTKVFKAQFGKLPSAYIKRGN
ncbi:hybrid sensor histidine kinase/response regulator [Mucilaginibacter limnophilus]|uniref:histidine kinase n=1 Tax=Mucilaginibacter limnophilus TaxID=1932778 RepID=A0A437MZF5_9SPHI|nr:hybrid sensor histidine kinase/response regulator transcription factor [Mucilaginibacter limnophilus]RVU03019.1 hybrid sensor histidine kinase/response regulator [Mucilaginibacter limnophilus]